MSTMHRQADREPATFESFDDWAHLVSAHRPPAVGHAGDAAPARVSPDALPYRPTIRPAMAVLRIVDDGAEDGELIRVRRDRIVIGRTAGDVLIPHDISMSPQHAAIERLGDSAWQLSDLGSAAGTFVRVTTARLRDGLVLLVGRTRLRFQSVDATEAWLVEERSDRPGPRHECHGPVTSLGRGDCGCGIGLDDPFVSQIHAEIRRTQRGWVIDNTGMNGLWVRIDGPVRMTAPAQFQCGEQRFVFMPCG
jgi:pSer/pThr/pTyr-binding forkhead associated (FHA) protein